MIVHCKAHQPSADERPGFQIEKPLRFTAHQVREPRLHIYFRGQVISFQWQADVRQPDPLKRLAVLHPEGSAQHLMTRHQRVQGRLQGRLVQPFAKPKPHLDVRSLAAARQTRK
ncbi:hypothetical protein AJ88_37635 [Mesorhizobium amorphae CCBAU 01583]|nr:hypothetical protein AJ88_37635 [Mesorhizobium amorphae CCBAU 01583]